MQQSIKPAKSISPTYFQLLNPKVENRSPETNARHRSVELRQRQKKETHVLCDGFSTKCPKFQEVKHENAFLKPGLSFQMSTNFSLPDMKSYESLPVCLCFPFTRQVCGWSGLNPAPPPPVGTSQTRLDCSRATQGQNCPQAPTHRIITVTWHCARKFCAAATL